MHYELIKSPFKHKLRYFFSETKKELLIVSPFVNERGVDFLKSANSKSRDIELSLLTNLSPNNVINEITQPSAILKLYDDFRQVAVSSLGNLHAKVYIVDQSKAMISSANLTSGGFKTNYEYGILLEEENIVRIVREDVLEYFSLGNLLEKSLITKIYREAERIKKLREKIDKSVSGSAISKLLKQRTASIEVELLKNRVKEGNTINNIFSNTIVYLLKSKGPLTTKELHPFIKSIHPDICNDSIDRVINGQHFGKKWKHMVRNSQQALKKQGVISLRGNRWYMLN